MEGIGAEGPPPHSPRAQALMGRNQTVKSLPQVAPQTAHWKLFSVVQSLGTWSILGLLVTLELKLKTPQGGELKTPKAIPH